MLVQPEEQVRVTEAIASVLQAIPPVEAIEPILVRGLDYDLPALGLT